MKGEYRASEVWDSGYMTGESWLYGELATWQRMATRPMSCGLVADARVAMGLLSGWLCVPARGGYVTDGRGRVAMWPWAASRSERREDKPTRR
eukprot:331638-Rhodomonas_salina.1